MAKADRTGNRIPRSGRIVITRGDAAYAGSDSSMASNSTSGIIRFFKEMTPFICFTS